MTITIQRPERATRPTGLLGYDQFQTAYVTNDLERATELVGSTYGIRNWTIFDAGGGMRIALAWINDQQIEIIHTGPVDMPLYDDWVDKNGEFAVRFHHLGYFVYSDEDWALLDQQLIASNRRRMMDTETETLKVIYADAPELGHYLEYILPNEKGKIFYESIATN